MTMERIDKLTKLTNSIIKNGKENSKSEDNLLLNTKNNIELICIVK